jgi:segregation and condensation protein B
MAPLEKNLASIEALLFIHGEPISHKKVESVLGLKKGEGEPIIAELKKRLEEDGRGLHLIVDKEKVQLATKPEFNKILEDFVKQELTEELTPASVEALSIVAYLGPISRAKIEYLRGVNSIVILRSLMIRGLVERIPDPEHPSGFLYQPTFDLIKHLGLSAKEDLPEHTKFQELLKVFDAQSAPGSPAAETVPAETAPKEPNG